MMCKHCHGVSKIVIGILILVNAYWWPKWWGIDGWVSFFGALMILGGAAKLLMSPCKDCAAMCAQPSKKKR